MRFFAILTLGFPLICLSVQANNFIPDAPVINFKLPMFNDEGFRAWEMQGDKGTYLSDEEVEVSGMVLRWYSGDEQNILDSTVESPQATLLIKENRAYGDDKIKVEGRQYVLVGESWSWDGKLKKMAINKNVKILFDQSLVNISNYENK